MTMQVVAAVNQTRTAPASLKSHTINAADLRDIDFCERMIVERAMRPRSWESDALAAAGGGDGNDMSVASGAAAR